MASKFRDAAKLGLFLVFAAALIVAGKAASMTMPYRLSYWEGFRFYRWVWIWYGAIAVALGCAPFWGIARESGAQRAHSRTPAAIEECVYAQRASPVRFFFVESFWFLIAYIMN